MTLFARVEALVPGMAPGAPRRNVLLALAYLVLVLVTVGFVVR
jgi:hypothetical protein